MLMIFDTFMMRYGVRSAQYLNSPNISKITDFHLPRNVVIHYLDQTIDAKFPNRNLYYFTAVEESKKIRIMNLTDLTRKEGITSLKNRYLDQDIRQWRASHRSTFRAQDLMAEPQDDDQNTGIVNYNTVKDLWNYRTSLLAEYDKNYNLISTFAITLHNLLKKDQKNYQLVSLTLPNNIPGVLYMKRLMSFNKKKMTDVIDDNNLYWLFEWYKWITDDFRKDSAFHMINDKDSEKILLEIKFRGYATYIKLSTLRALSENSPLESNKKFNDAKVRKFFLFFLMKLQETITDLNVTGLDTTRELEDDSDPLDYDSDEDAEEAIDEEIEEEVKRDERRDAKLISNTAKIDVDAIAETGDIFNTLDDGLDSLFKEADKYEKAGLDRLNNIENGIASITKPVKVKEKGESEGDDVDEDDHEIEEVEAIDVTKVDEAELSKILDEPSKEKMLDNFIKKGEVTGALSSSEIKSLRTAQEKRNRLKDPYTNSPVDTFTPTPEDDTDLTEEITKIDTEIPVIADNMLTDKTSKFDQLYVKNLMKKDIIACVMNIEKAGAMITDYKTEVIRSAVDNYELHRFEIRPYEGKSTPVYLRIPIVDEEGNFMVGGRKYRMRKVRQDLPIRKISSTRVGLTSNYGKFFVTRTPRKAYDQDQYVLDFVRKDYLSGEGQVTKIIPGKKRLNLVKGLPNLYFKLASELDGITTKNCTFIFKREEVHSVVKPEDLKAIEKDGRVFIGYTNKGKELLAIDRSGNLINMTKKENLGPLYKEFGISTDKLPKSFSSITVIGKEIPFAVVMSYYMGITNLIKVTKTKYRLVPSNVRHTGLEENEIEIKFSDFRLIPTLDTEEKRLIFNGFLYYRDFIKMYKLNSFESKDIYLNLVEYRGAALYNLKELDILERLFIDPITKSVLEEMGEPTEFRRLLFRANEMLSDYAFPDINDPEYSRLRGYDRVPGLMYRALAESMREHNLKGRLNSRISLDPYKVWNYITQDSSIQAREALNPVSSIKEDEVITLTGRDGPSTKAIPKELRRYHKNDVGLISESTSDSKNVAITANLSPYAKLKNLRGMVEPGFDEIEENPAKIFSTPIQVSPMSEYDDPKRINYTSIQLSHTVESKGYRQSPLRTGYEYLVPYKTGTNFCKMADEDGTVVSKTKDVLTVKYKSGKEESFKIGEVYTNYEGVGYKNPLATTLKEGDKFKKYDNLYYHESFFEPDWLDKRRIVFKINRIYTLACVSNPETFEDSSAISTRVMKEITTNIVKERSFILNFDTNISNVVNVGDEVLPNDALFIDTGEGYSAGNLNESSLSLLESIASMSPRAKYKGFIDRIEVKYNGDISDMTESLAKLVQKIDRETYLSTKGTLYEIKNNKVTGEYSSNGKKLDIDTLELKFFISVTLDMAVGDKLVVANQAKSVIGEVFTYNMEGSESNDPIDVMMATVGFIYRVIDSPIRMGTTNRLTRHVSKQAADVYFGKK